MSFEKQLVSCEKPLCCHIVTRLNLPCVYEKEGLLQLYTVQIFKKLFAGQNTPKSKFKAFRIDKITLDLLYIKHQRQRNS